MADPTSPGAEVDRWAAYGQITVPPPVAERDGLAVLALALGLLPLLTGLPAVIVGLLAAGRAKRNGRRGRTMALVGAGLGAFWLVALVVAAEAGVFEPATHPSRGTINLLALRQGDCLDSVPTRGGQPVGSGTIVPCADSHLAEVFDVSALPSGDYPGSDAALLLASAHCNDALPPYLAVSTAGTGGFQVLVLVPASAAEWHNGDHRMRCLLSAPQFVQLFGSARGAGPYRYTP